MANQSFPGMHQPGPMIRTFRIDVIKQLPQSPHPSALAISLQTDSGIIRVGLNPASAGHLCSQLDTSLDDLRMNFDADELLEKANESSSPLLQPVRDYLALPEPPAIHISEAVSLIYTTVISFEAEPNTYNFDFSLTDNSSFRASMSAVLVPVFTTQLTEAIGALIAP